MSEWTPNISLKWKDSSKEDGYYLNTHIGSITNTLSFSFSLDTVVG